MTKKWNLQDIQPANRPRRAPKRMAAQAARAKVAPVVSDELELESEDTEAVAIRKIADDTNTSRREPTTMHADMRPARRRPRLRNQHEPDREEEHFDTIEIVDGNASNRNKIYVAVAVFFIIVVGGIITSALTGGADVEVKPRFVEKNVVANFTGSETPQENVIPYELLTLEADGERQVKASGQETVTKQAEGTLLVYNEYSTSPVRLVANTRFETPTGKIFKVKESVVVPGYTTDADGNKIRGVVTADVFAEAPGDDYNVGPTNFTIPGFKGYEEYDTVYAESTGDMTGGFSGQKFIIDEAELETARQGLHTELRDALLSRLKSQVPAGFVLYDNAVTFTFTSLPSVAYGDDLATIKEEGVLRVPLFKEDSFAKFLAEQSVQDYKGLPVRLADYQALEFSYTSPTTTVSDISAQTELPFNLTGDIKIIWEFDENALKADLLGIEKTEIEDILKKYPAIDQASAEVRPFWKTSFPREMKEINVTEIVE